MSIYRRMSEEPPENILPEQPFDAGLYPLGFGGVGTNIGQTSGYGDARDRKNRHGWRDSTRPIFSAYVHGLEGQPGWQQEILRSHGYPPNYFSNQSNPSNQPSAPQMGGGLLGGLFSHPLVLLAIGAAALWYLDGSGKPEHAAPSRGLTVRERI